MQFHHSTFLLLSFLAASPALSSAIPGFSGPNSALPSDELRIGNSFPVDPDARGAFIQSRLTCLTTNSSPRVSDIQAVENALRARIGECFQADTEGCQTHGEDKNTGVRIQLCGYPIWHGPCGALSSMSKLIRDGCVVNGRAAGTWKLFGSAKVQVGL